jgi:hypothetical protein
MSSGHSFGILGGLILFCGWHAPQIYEQHEPIPRINWIAAELWTELLVS